MWCRQEPQRTEAKPNQHQRNRIREADLAHGNGHHGRDRKEDDDYCFRAHVRRFGAWASLCAIRSAKVSFLLNDMGAVQDSCSTLSRPLIMITTIVLIRAEPSSIPATAQFLAEIE